MEKSPIIKQILAFGVISAVIALVLACVGFAIVEYYKIRDTSTIKLQSQVDLLAYNLQPTLLFDDKDAADKILQSLNEDLSITKAVLYKTDGSPFSSYIRNTTPANIRLSKDIFYNSTLIGRLSIESIYLGIQDKAFAYLLISLLIIILSIPASYFISGPIRHQVSEAVTQLEQQSDRLRQLADQVAMTEQQERKRIAALIHDHLQQILAASKIQFELALRRFIGHDYTQAEVKLTHGLNLLNEATLAARSLTVELRPPVLYEAGLNEAFQWLANKFKTDHNFMISLKIEDIPVIVSDNLKILIFESVKELLFNAVKYAGVHAAELSVKYRDGFILSSVKDRGRGFETQDIEKISSAKGFGLFSIRERIKLLNGSVEVISEPGEGTEIVLKVPVSPAAAEVSNKTARQEEKVPLISKGRKKRINILLVDDHKIVREGLANLLKENEVFNVVAQAENGIEAIDKTGEMHPDVVIMDINMPRLNGIEATRVIKHKFPNVKVIGLSVQNEREVAESMKRAGAATLVNKSGDSQELIETILRLSA